MVRPAGLNEHTEVKLTGGELSHGATVAPDASAVYVEANDSRDLPAPPSFRPMPLLAQVGSGGGGSLEGVIDVRAAEIAIKDDFYAKFDNGKFSLHHGFLAGIRPNDPYAVTKLFETVKADKGGEMARKVITRYFSEILKRTPVSWDSMQYYLSLSEAFRKDDDQLVKGIGDFILQQCRTFVQKNKDSCPNAFEQMCKEIDQRDSEINKAKYHFATGGVGRVWDKVVRKVEDKLLPGGAAGIGSEYKNGALSLSNVGGALTGFKIDNVDINGETVAVIITGNYGKGARVFMDISIGGGATVESIEERYPGSVQYQGPGGFQHGAKLPQELTIFKGNVARDLPPDATRHHGYVIVLPDGRFHIVDKREIRLSELTCKEEDSMTVYRLCGNGDISDIQAFKEKMKELGASLIPTMLHIHNGRVEWADDNGNDERRLLVEFGDGTFGVISTITGGRMMGINDMMMLVMRVGEERGGVKNAVYLDTGHYDYTSYYTYEGGKRNRTVIGHKDHTTQMCRIGFKQGE